MSPTAMVITAEQLRRGASLSLADALRMEVRLVDRFLEDHDFYEGECVEGEGAEFRRGGVIEFQHGGLEVCSHVFL